MLYEFLIFIGHGEALAVLECFSVGNIFHFAVMIPNDASDRLNICAKEFLSGVRLVNLLFE